MKRPTDRKRSATKDDKGLTRIAGLAAVSALFATAPHRVERLFFHERMKTLAGAFCADLGRARKTYRLVAPEELARIAGTPMHGGIIAFAQPRPVPAFDADEAAGWARAGEPLLLLDGVGNPHNLGAIARTAAFFGLPRIVLSDNPAQAGVSDASYRVAEGGLEYVQVYRAERFAHMLKRLRRSYRVVGTAAAAGQEAGSLAASERPVALVLGNEERGLPRTTLDACEEIVTIRGSGFVQSLNVAASAAILIHAMMAAPAGGAMRARTREGVP